MRKASILASTLIALTLGVSQAKDVTGAFGVGYDGTLGGVNGLALKMQVTPMLGVGLVSSLDMTMPDVGDGVTTLDLAVLVPIQLAEAGDLNVSIVPGVNLMNVTEDLAWAVEAALEGELFLAPSFSVNTGTGIVFSQDANDNQRFRTNGDLLSSAGFTIWFK